MDIGLQDTCPKKRGISGDSYSRRRRFKKDGLVLLIFSIYFHLTFTVFCVVGLCYLLHYYINKFKNYFIILTQYAFFRLNVKFEKLCNTCWLHRRQGHVCIQSKLAIKSCLVICQFCLYSLMNVCGVKQIRVTLRCRSLGFFFDTWLGYYLLRNSVYNKPP